MVRDERDAYQQLQSQFTGQIDTKSKQIESDAQEKERLLTDFRTVNQIYEESKNAMNRILFRFGVFSVYIFISHLFS